MGLLPAESSDETVNVTGYVSAPSAARGNRNYQFFFVNGRPIKSKTLQAALEQAFSNKLPSGKYPSCVLYIKTRFSDVDVNVHPAKTEVKFVSDKQVFDGIYYAALGAIQHGHQFESDTPVGATVPGRPHPTPSYGSDIPVGATVPGRPHPITSYGSDTPVGATVPGRPHPTYTHGDIPLYEPGESLYQTSPKENYRMIGEALSTYIVVDCGYKVVFIDKHAAHERIHFNALKSDNYEPMAQHLIEPEVCRLGVETATLVLENAELLSSLGFSVESFGDESIAVRQIPSEIEIEDTETVLSDICSNLKLGGPVNHSGRDAIFRSIACKAAIKAGKSSAPGELKVLVKRVMSGEIAECPHGRPLSFELTKTTLDRKFGRI
jgi:DNA mismatch repair protein MutL